MDGDQQNELQHRGVLGMRWGIKRGEKTSSAHVAKKEPAKKKVDVKSMSDDDLKKIVQRLQLEKQYTTLAPKNINKGKEIAQNILKAGKTVADVSNTGLTLYNNAGKIKDIIKSQKK